MRRDVPRQRSVAEVLHLIESECALVKIMHNPLPKKVLKQDLSPIFEDAAFKKLFEGNQMLTGLFKNPSLFKNNLKTNKQDEKNPEKPRCPDAWDTVIASLNNPASNRYVKLKPDIFAVDRCYVVNPRTLDENQSQDPKTIKWVKRDVSTVRGAPKPSHWLFTKKTATSLLPPDGKMKFYQSVNFDENGPVGLLFDIHFCDLKNEKYIWKSSGITDSRWWLKSNDTYTRTKSISLNELREYLRHKITLNEVPSHNEILACVSKEALMGVFAPEDELVARLNAWKIQMRLQEGLDKVLPILVIDPNKSPREYDAQAQCEDIKACLQEDKDSVAYQLLISFIPNPSDYLHRREEVSESRAPRRPQI